jgi:hypothetical protein
MSNYYILKFNIVVRKIELALRFIWFTLWIRNIDKAFCSIVFTIPQKTQIKNDKSYFSVIFKWFSLFYYIVISVLMAPLGFITYTTWFVLYRRIFRKLPYRLSIKNVKNLCKYHNNDQNQKKDEFNLEITSANICLLPETLSRLNNFHSLEKRLKTIGNLLAKTGRNDFCNNQVNGLDINVPSELSLSNIERELSSPSSKIQKNEIKNDFDLNIIDDYEHSVDADFICLQEVWTVDTAIKLKDLLHFSYPYIVYDVGEDRFRKNGYIGFDSGLLIASKYPIVNVSYKPFTNFFNHARFTSVGFLIIKVLIGSNNKSHLIGFISNTHLQAYQSESHLLLIFEG